MHGELWLCPDGLLRLSLGLAATIRKSSSPRLALEFDRAARKSGVRRFDQNEINELRSRKRSNVWVPWAHISEGSLREGSLREGSLREGVITGRLRLTLADGRSVKFLWMRDRRVFQALHERLLERLGPAAVGIA